LRDLDRFRNARDRRPAPEWPWRVIVVAGLIAAAFTTWLAVDGRLSLESTGGSGTHEDLIRGEGGNPLDGGLLGGLDIIDGQEPLDEAPANGADEPTATATPELTPTPTPDPPPTPDPEAVTEASETPTPDPSASPSPTPTPTPDPTPSPSPHPLSCSRGVLLDFAGLSTGTVIDEQYAPFGIHISGVAKGEGSPNAIIVFDSNASGSKDPDLEVDVGNIAILADNLDDENGDGLVDKPDESIFGGKQIYVFDQPVSIGSFLFIDKDHGTPEKAIAYDASNNVIKQVLIPVAGNASVQTVHVDATNVSRFVIDYRDSGGLTQIEVCFQDPTPAVISTATPPPSPSPTPTALEIISLPSTGGRDGSGSSYFGLAVLITGAVSLVAASLVAIRFGGKRETDQD